MCFFSSNQTDGVFVYAGTFVHRVFVRRRFYGWASLICRVLHPIFLKRYAFLCTMNLYDFDKYLMGRFYKHGTTFGLMYTYVQHAKYLQKQLNCLIVEV